MTLYKIEYLNRLDKRKSVEIQAESVSEAEKIFKRGHTRDDRIQKVRVKE
jgi:hypothetical protein